MGLFRLQICALWSDTAGEMSVMRCTCEYVCERRIKEIRQEGRIIFDTPCLFGKDVGVGKRCINSAYKSHSSDKPQTDTIKDKESVDKLPKVLL